jgi:hypothetical protein
MTGVEALRESVVVSQVRDLQRVAFHPVNHAMFIGDAT